MIILFIWYIIILPHITLYCIIIIIIILPQCCPSRVMPTRTAGTITPRSLDGKLRAAGSGFSSPAWVSWSLCIFRNEMFFLFLCISHRLLVDSVSKCLCPILSCLFLCRMKQMWMYRYMFSSVQMIRWGTHVHILDKWTCHTLHITCDLRVQM